MASTTRTGYQPAAPIDWEELLQSLAAHIEAYEKAYGADRLEPPIPCTASKTKAKRIGCYITDLEYCLHKANGAIAYYEDLVKNYDRLVAVMEESRNQAYDVIGRLKHEIGIAKKYRPLAFGEKGDSDG